MKSPAFLSPNMSIMLDLVRGLAALVVLVGHGMGLDMYTGPGQLPKQLPHDAVIVFFVLSGLVIAHSTMVRTNSLRDYAIARCARILPVAWFAILFSLALFLLCRQLGLQDQMPAPFNRATLATVGLPFIFMSESAIGQGLVWNSPYWSLAYEVWFYILFGAWLFVHGKWRVTVLAVLAFLAGWKVLVLLPIWLLGAALVRHADKTCISLKTSPLALIGGGALCVAAHWISVDAVYAIAEATGIDRKLAGSSQFMFTDLPMGLGIALVFVGLRPLAERAGPLLQACARPIRWLAGFSFTLYLLHIPILLVIRGHGIGAGDNLLVFAVMNLVVIGICALLAQVIEHRSPQLRTWLNRWATRPRGAAVAA